MGGMPLFKTGSAYKDNLTIAKSDTATGNITPAAYDGYTPIAVVGFDIDNATSSGTGGSYAQILAIRMSGSIGYYQVHNRNSSSSIKLKVNMYFLYVRTGLI